MYCTILYSLFAVNQLRETKDEGPKKYRKTEHNLRWKQVPSQDSPRTLTDILTTEKAMELVNCEQSPSYSFSSTRTNVSKMSKMSKLESMKTVHKTRVLSSSHQPSVMSTKQRKKFAIEALSFESEDSTMGKPKKKPMRSVVVERNSELLINPNCLMQLIMDYILEKLHLDKCKVQIDLSDETGKVLELHMIRPYESGLTILTPRKTYYLLVYEMEGKVVQRLQPLFREHCEMERVIIGKIQKYKVG